MRTSSLLLWPVLLVLGATVAGCSGAADQHRGRFIGSAEDVIEGHLAEQIGFGELDAVCDAGTDRAGAPVKLTAGDLFDCSAFDRHGRTLRFEATVEDDGLGVAVRSSNLLPATQLSLLESAVARRMTDEGGVEVEPDDLDCGSVSLLVDDGDAVACTAQDPGGVVGVYEVSVLLHDVATLMFDVTIGERVG